MKGVDLGLSAHVVVHDYEPFPQNTRTHLLTLCSSTTHCQVRDFVYISDRAYTREQILQMEKIMLNTLRFNLTVPTAHQFLARYLKLAGSTRDTELARCATYLIELALPNYPSLRWSGSVMAGAALSVASQALGRADALPALCSSAQIDRAAARECASHLGSLMAGAPSASLTAVFKKYSSDKYGAVARLPAPVLGA